MTMSQLLKQTKKCCVKIIRKFSSGTPSSGGGTGDSDVVTSSGRSISLNNRATAKYVLHKNCTPTRCKIQPTVPEGFGEATASWTDEPAPVSPVRRRLEGLSPSTPTEKEVPVTQNNYRASRDAKNQPKKRTNINSNKNVNIRKCFRLRKGFKDELGGEEMNNGNGAVVSSKLDKINKTLYLVARGGPHQDEDVVYSESKAFGGVNANNLNSQASEKSKISKPLFLSAKQKKYNQIETQFSADDDVEFDRLNDDEIVPYEMDAIRAESSSHDGSRLQFELSQPLPETSGSPRPGGSTSISNNYEEVVFEKVKFDQNKRYLRNGTTSSPSTASNLSHSGSCVAHSAGSVFEYDPDHPLSQYAGVASKSEDFIDSWRNYNVNSRWNKVAKNPWDAEVQKAESPVMFAHEHPSWSNFIDESPRESSSPAPAAQQHRSSAGKTYPPPYQVRTDIWQNLNNKNYEIDSDVFWRTSNSSRRTSASTVETWIEDEAFDNSFNEELERRCATLKI
ncbi:uncharacterized protein LOC129767824 [Toxorhynchites rutilus septentrionalis]|uniref:uncharacterized protein LOC129767824 n=1 Tax=Toxorhynchites rutilus septentrionalis TaxID=329112 RepID=UPI0024796BAE|nr:uncharacterized protein LOC129767824 [Toxorhynchites rutilus septentrionalis]